MGVFENDMIREKIKSYNAPDPINKHPEEETLMGEVTREKLRNSRRAWEEFQEDAWTLKLNMQENIDDEEESLYKDDLIAFNLSVVFKS